MDPVVLLARAGLLALTTVLLGVAGHLTTGGATGPGPVVLLGAVVLVVGLRALRTPAGALRVVALLAGGQAVVHAGLAALAALGAQAVAPPGGAARPVAGALALPVDHGRRLGSLQDSHAVATGHADLAHVTAGQVVAGVGHQAPLLTAHLLVALALGLALALGERCLWTLVALLTATWRRLLRPLTPVLGRPVAPGRALRRALPAPHLLLLDLSRGRRGPPAVLAAP